MSKPWPRDYNMPKVDPDKEDETKELFYIEDEELPKDLNKEKIDEWMNEQIEMFYSSYPKLREWQEQVAKDVAVHGRAARTIEFKGGKITSLHTPKTCNHEWKHYIGLSEQFDYCTKCDEKRK